MKELEIGGMYNIRFLLTDIENGYVSGFALDEHGNKLGRVELLDEELDSLTEI